MPVDTITVKLSFDPWTTEATQSIFSDGFTRKFYLLWRRDHMVSNEFNGKCLELLEKWKEARPLTPQELINSITMDGVDFSSNDVRNFVVKYNAYLFGDARVGFQINLGEAQG